VRRVATGWESELTVAVDGVISRLTVFELVEGFYAQRSEDGQGPATRLRLRSEILAGLWEALVSGQADLAIGGLMNAPQQAGIEVKPMGSVDFVFAVAPHHPLAQAEGPLSDAQILAHRAVAVADSAQRLAPVTVNLLPGQDVFTVPTMAGKIEALIRCLGCGYVAEPMVREHLRTGVLVARPVQRAPMPAQFGYAWRGAATPQPRKAPQGLALQWWLNQLESPATRRALLERHVGLMVPLE
jgi:DNA-binding transcriptional LysR family regulator